MDQKNPPGPKNDHKHPHRHPEVPPPESPLESRTSGQDSSPEVTANPYVMPQVETPGQAAPAPTLGGADAQIAGLQAELDDLQARLLRVSADYQNFARRSQQNIEDAKQQQLMSFARALLTVFDHFDRALEVDPQNTSSQSLLRGVKIVSDELYKLLEKWEIRKIAVNVGDAFDPLVHEAVMHQKAGDPGAGGQAVKPGQVAGVLQSGYTLGDKTLRPAKVSIGQ